MSAEGEAWLQGLTLEEKALLTVGHDGWHTAAIPRLGIPALTMHDGPHGLRVPRGDELMGDAVPATCFPSGAALGQSWDVALMRAVGEALAAECQAHATQVLLGPAINIKRTPLGGRGFEYLSEDPVLAGDLAAAWIQGIQSGGVGASLKHYACNNQEWNRQVVSAEVDERTLREIYLAPFERAVKAAQPWTVMAAYNRVNGTYCTEHPHLLQEILRGEWGYEGVVVSDWTAVNEKVDALRAGMDLEMPGPVDQTAVVEAVRQGTLPAAVLDDAVRRILALVERGLNARRPETLGPDERDAHHRLAQFAAEQSIVLLKNERAALPLEPTGPFRLAVIGPSAREAHFQGGGSGETKPTRVVTPLEGLLEAFGAAVSVTYAPGCSLHGEASDVSLAKAVEAAREADAAVVFAGLPPGAESEGYDRRTLDLPDGVNRLVQAVAAAQPRTVVVLSTGGPVTMPWLSAVPAVVQMGLAGQAHGAAIARVLTGVVNPSGKLAETYPARLADTPSFLNYPGEKGVVRYGEGLFVGYRYYDRKQIEPLFPFGFGLSYTQFDYGTPTLSHRTLTDHDTLTIQVPVTNSGTRPGQEVVQVYVRDVASRVMRPNQELKAFAKVTLAPGAAATVPFQLVGRDFAYYDVAAREWLVEGGEFEILIGASSRDLRCRACVVVEPAVVRRRRFTASNTMADLLELPEARKLLHSMLPPWLEWDGENLAPQGLMGFLLETPLGKLERFAGGHVAPEAIQALIRLANI